MVIRTLLKYLLHFVRCKNLIILLIIVGLSYKCDQQLDQGILFENALSLEDRNFCTISSALQ